MYSISLLNTVEDVVSIIRIQER